MLTLSFLSRRLLTLVVCFTLSGLASGQTVDVVSGTMIAVDSVAPNHHTGPYRLVQYDLDGNVLGTLTLVDHWGLGIPTGVTVLGGDVFVSGTQNAMAQVDLETGELFGFFYDSLFGLEGAGELNGHLLTTTYRYDTVHVLTREGGLVEEITLSPHAEVTGVDSDGEFLYTVSFQDGDIDVWNLSGGLVRTIPTGIDRSSASEISYDRSSDTLWVTTGFGSDEIHQYDLDGNLLQVTAAGFPFLNGIDHVDDLLILDAEPNFAIGGDSLEFRIFDGTPGEAVLHVVSSVAGSPVLLPLLLTDFEIDGVATWSTTVPPGLAPLVIGHRAYTLDATGELVVSNEELVFHH